MTSRLEDLLNLPENKDINPPKPTSKTKQNATERAIAKKTAKPDNMFKNMDEFDKIASALPKVKGLGDISDSELDELAMRATNAYDDLMDLGMNVEARYSARIFEVASSMLKNAIDAKSSKIDKKLKMIELQLKKQKLDQESKPKEDIVAGEGHIVSNRNSLIEKLKNLK